MTKEHIVSNIQNLLRRQKLPAGRCTVLFLGRAWHVEWDGSSVTGIPGLMESSEIIREEAETTREEADGSGEVR